MEYASRSVVPPSRRTYIERHGAMSPPCGDSAPSAATPPDRRCDVSIVVPTRDRAEMLPALLQRLCAQAAPSLAFEVLVVDNGSRDGTAALVETFMAQDERIHYVSERRRGASRARNAGIAAAHGTIVAFIDDDLLPDHDWVATIADAFAAHPEVHCIGGRVDPAWPVPPPAWLTAINYPPLALQINRGNQYIDATNASACLVTANFACRRAVFDDVGTFSPDYLRDEDREFNLRLWRAGKRGLYVDAVRAVAVVQPERLTKAYHRQWYDVTGTNHARMRYREIIAHDGRLVPPMEGRTIFGLPRYLWRELLQHVGRWIAAAAARRRDLVFREECHVRYLVSYLRERRRHIVALRSVQQFRPEADRRVAARERC